MNETTKKSEAEAVADLVRETNEPILMNIERGNTEACQVMVFPAVKDGEAASIEGLKSYLDEYRTEPERRIGTAHLQDLASFVNHATRFADNDSALFADITSGRDPRLVCMLDYHRKGAVAAPRYLRHVGVYSFPVSEEWKAWKNADDQWMSQEDFAAFVEEQILDVMDPKDAGDAAQRFATALECKLATPNRLIQLSRGLAVNVNAKVARAVNLSTGEAQIQYQEAHETMAGPDLKVPGAFLLAIPVFTLGDRFQVSVRLRYRLREGNIRWSVALYRPELIWDTALREACEKASADTGLPLFYGTPES